MFIDIGPGHRLRLGNDVVLTVLHIDKSQVQLILEGTDRVAEIHRQDRREDRVCGTGPPLRLFQLPGAGQGGVRAVN